MTLSLSSFQLTRPVWGEPRRRYRNISLCPISTHSPRVGRTILDDVDILQPADFNSLAPCGANPIAPVTRSNISSFQLTRPVWGEPARRLQNGVFKDISTHSPRVGRTRARSMSGYTVRKFQLTRPVWGEPGAACCFLVNRAISTHSPRVGRTLFRR